MKSTFRWLLATVVVALIGVSFACTNGDPGCPAPNETTTPQEISVTIPPMIQLVIDNPADFASWDIDLSNGIPEGAQCYVLPNWIGDADVATFLADNNFHVDANGDISGGSLVSAAGSTGYPPTFLDSEGAVQSWSDVTSAGAYVSGHSTDPAKGHLLCVNKIMIEKYTNCDDIQFGVTVTRGTGDDGLDYGALFMQDFVRPSGDSGLPVEQTMQEIAVPSATPTALLDGAVQQFTWMDDFIAQALYLRNAAEGTRVLEAVYTLGTLQ